MPRTEVTKKLWHYIKRKGLQDQKERRMINADDALKVVFGGKTRVSMFDMTKLVNSTSRTRNPVFAADTSGDSRRTVRPRRRN